MLLQIHSRFCHHNCHCNYSSLNLQRLSVIVSSFGPVVAAIQESHTAKTTITLSPPWTLPWLCLYRFYWDRPPPICYPKKTSPSSESSHALTRRLNILHLGHAPQVQDDIIHDVIIAMSALVDVSIQSSSCDLACVSTWSAITSSCWCHHRWLLIASVDCWLPPFNYWPLSIDLLSGLTFCSPNAPYLVFSVDFIFAVKFWIFCI